MPNIISNYIENVLEAIDKKIKFTIKPIGGKPIYLSINQNLKIKDLYSLLITKYPKYNNTQFFLIRSGNIIDLNDNILDYEKEEALYLIIKNDLYH